MQSRETAFHAITSAKAAGFVEEAGWLWVTNYGDVDAEYRAVREGVGMWDLSPLNKWEFRGADALEAARRVHTNDVMGMRDGQVRYGAFVDEDGLMVDDGTVFRHSAEHLWVCTNGNERAEYFADATKGLDVEIRYVAPELPSMQIQGPESRDLVRSIVSGADVDALAYFSFFPDPVRVGGAPVWLSRTGFSGELGYELFLRPEHARGRVGRGRGRGCRALRGGHHRARARGDRHGRHRLRLRAAPAEPVRPRPRPARDARRRGGVHGRRPSARDGGRPAEPVRHDPARGPTLPEYGAAVRVAGEEVGVLTSPAASPLLGPLGLAILRTDVGARRHRGRRRDGRREHDRPARSTCWPSTTRRRNVRAPEARDRSAPTRRNEA